jgi:UDP-glucose 4-epimerase
MANTSQVVILGHTGFIGGRLLAHYAAAGVRVYGYGSSTLDLRDASAFSVLDGVLGPHTALYVPAAVTPDRGVTLDALSNNFSMMLNLARYLDQHPVQRCVYISSDAVYPMVSEAVTEESKIEPSNFYALAKYSGERMLQSVADSRGFPLLIVRPTAVYGPGDTHNGYGPNRFVRSILGDRTIRLFGAGEENRDHLYIDDLITILVTLTSSSEAGVFNAATGQSRTFGLIAEDLRDITPLEFQVESLPRQGAITHRHFDIKRLRDAIPDLEFTPFKQGLKTTLAAAQA